MKKYVLWTSFYIFLSLILSLVMYRELSLLHFIDTTFYITGIILLFSLFTMVIQKGFFDGIFYSFRKLFESQKDTSEKEDISRLSELLTINLGLSFLIGISLLVVVLAGLGVYYL